MSKKIRKEEDPTKVCILCGSKNVKLVYEGLETDTYKCLDCGKEYGVTDWRRIAGFTKQEIEKVNELNGIKDKLGSWEAKHMYTFTIQEINKTYGTNYVSEISALEHYFKPAKPLEEN